MNDKSNKPRKLNKIDKAYLEFIEKLSDSDKKSIQDKINSVRYDGVITGIVVMIVLILLTLKLGFFKIGPWSISMTFGLGNIDNWSINFIE